jgi:hypothetical protein
LADQGGIFEARQMAIDVIHLVLRQYLKPKVPAVATRLSAVKIHKREYYWQPHHQLDVFVVSKMQHGILK